MQVSELPLTPGHPVLHVFGLPQQSQPLDNEAYTLPTDQTTLGRQHELESRYQTIAEIYHAFRQEHGFEEDGNELGRRSSEELVTLSSELQQQLAQALGIETKGLRPLDPEALQQFAQAMKDGGKVLMRHGPQDSQKSKLDQMKLPDNMTDPATLGGLAEFATTLLGIEYTLDQIHWAHPDKRIAIDLEIISSRNQRALDIANVVGKVFKNAPVQVNDNLTCMNYDQSVEHGNPNLNADDSVAWDQQRIDAVFGEGSFDKKTAQVKELFAPESNPVANTITVTFMFGHTQDTNAADKIAGRTPTRLSNFGLIAQPEGRNLSMSLELPNGFYGQLPKPQTVANEPEVIVQPVDFPQRGRVAQLGRRSLAMLNTAQRKVWRSEREANYYLTHLLPKSDTAVIFGEGKNTYARLNYITTTADPTSLLTQENLSPQQNAALTSAIATLKDRMQYVPGFSPERVQTLISGNHNAGQLQVIFHPTDAKQDRLVQTISYEELYP